MEDMETKSVNDVQVVVSAGVETTYKTTKDGVLLVPQPTEDPEEPLNWSPLKKHLALGVLVFETFFCKASATFISPAASELAKEFGVTRLRATYIATITAIVPALAPLIWIPFSQRIGRRPVLLGASLTSMAFNLGLANAQTYGAAVACRFFGYAAASAGLCITPAAISDMFFHHEKGKRMGINTFLLVTSPYLGAVIGGTIDNSPELGWRWSMYIASILYAGLFISILLFVPETIYDRQTGKSETPEAKKTLARRLGFRTPQPRETWLETYKRPYTMFAYPAVLLPSIWFSVAFMTEVANTAGFALNFGPGTRYDFNVQQVGFCSFSGLIGAIVGEWVAGPLCDLVAKRHLRTGQVWRPEQLLKLCVTGAIAMPAGLLLYGLELNYPTSWVAALAGISIFVFGQEIGITVLLTYLTDSYPGQAAEVAVVFQFFLNIMAYHPPFYFQLWIESSGARVPYIVAAVLPIVLFPFGIGLFMWRGTEIRARGSLPWSKKKS